MEQTLTQTEKENISRDIIIDLWVRFRDGLRYHEHEFEFSKFNFLARKGILILSEEEREEIREYVKEQWQKKLKAYVAVPNNRQEYRDLKNFLENFLEKIQQKNHKKTYDDWCKKEALKRFFQKCKDENIDLTEKISEI